MIFNFDKSMISLLLTVLCNSMNLVVINCSELIALNSSPHALQLYRNLLNEGAVPKEDTIILDAESRESFCEEIYASKFFDTLGWLLLDMKNIARNLRLLPHSNSYQSAGLSYDKKILKLADASDTEEHVFSCLFTKLERRLWIPAYVSKEYNVGSFGQPYMAGRFVFVSLDAEDSNDSDKLILDGPYLVVLAEEPANVVTKPDFEVEQHYLEMRKDLPLAESNESDPLCKLISKDPLDPNNQHQRLCVAVSRSTVYKDKLKYPKPAPAPCFERTISFKTAETNGKMYSERMTLCQFEQRDHKEPRIFLFLSRAYKSNHIFVYRGNPSTRKIYLEHLFTNVDVKDTGSSFNFMETKQSETISESTRSV